MTSMPGDCSRSTFGAIPACLHLAVLHGGGVHPVLHPAFRLIAPCHLPVSHCPGYLLSCRLPPRSFACHLLAVRLHGVRILRPDLQRHEMSAYRTVGMCVVSLVVVFEEPLHAACPHVRGDLQPKRVTHDTCCTPRGRQHD